MTKINIITPPDKLFNKNYTILLIGARQALLDEIQNSVLPSWNHNTNIYYCDKDTSHTDDIDWLLSVFAMSDLVLLDVDNCSIAIRNLTSYFVSEEKTYWLTNEQQPVYNHLSKNRIYNAQFMLEIGGKIGKEAH